eukprot:GFUD01040114.1.p1 GENE.GFUD01040114.1~~GFUD01040114.1.p1  ORF type:complete len:1103 (-),score=286.31 GFUD01040114.1:106-3414(-)
MHVSYLPNVVDREVMSEVSLPRPNPRPSSTSKIMIGRRKPSGLPPNQSSVSNASLISGLSGSCVGSIKNSLPVGPVGKAMVRVGGTATPNRGPGRFVSVNLGKNTGAEAVAKQTQMVMKNLKNFQDGLMQSAGLDMTPPRSLSQGVELPRSYSQARDKENMPSNIPRVQSNSPARSRLPLSPLKNMNNLVLNEISQEFSPSPVKRVAGREMFVNRVVTEPIVETAAHDMITSTSAKAYVSIARMDVSEYAIKDATKRAMEAPVADTSDEDTEEVDVLVRNLPRPSDSFQPTPARFANINGKKSARKIKAFRKNPKETVECDNNDEVEEDNEVGGTNIAKKPFKPGVSRPSEADLGFVPPTRAPSEMSEVTFNFKKPTAPQKVSGTKRKEAHVDNDTLRAQCRYLQSWIPRLRNKRLYVEGDLLDLDNSCRGVGQDERWLSSKIVKRLSSNRVATKKGTVYVLVGQLVVRNIEGENVGDATTPNFIIDKFKDGFPEKWERLTKHWIKLNDQTRINAVNISNFNSTRMTNMSMASMTAIENISSIPANASRYLTSTPRVPASQLTFDKGPTLSILPEEEQDLTRPQVEVIVARTTTSRSRSNKGKSGAKTSTGRDISDQRSRSPLRKEEQGGGAGSPQTEHRSRSKTVRQNNNTRSKEVQDTSQVGSLLEVTMSQHDITLLRAKAIPPPSNSDKSERRQTHTPGLGTFVCFACNFSSNEDLKMFNHLMSSGHERKVKTCVEKRYLSCNVCLHFTNRKDDFIKHMRSEKHIQTLTKIKGGNLEKRDVLEKSVEINKSLEENLRNTKKQSSFGRNIKKTKALTRKSCEYGTPEEIVEEAVPSKRPHNSRKPKHQVNESLRRTVLNPFKRVELEDPPVRNIVKSTEDIFEKMSANPKTVVKQKQQNVDALKEFNENHEDDIFDEPNKSKSKSTLLKPSTKTLLSQESDSDSEQDISVHSARTPMTAYFGKSGLRTMNQDKTPGILTQDSSVATVNGEGFQAQAYIHKKVAEKAKDSRKLKRNKLATALVSKVVSRSQADKQVDQSSQIINTVMNHTANTAHDEEEDQAGDWFDLDLSLSNIHLSCDPGAGLLELFSRQPGKGNYNGC